MINTTNKKWNIKRISRNETIVNDISIGLGITLPLARILVNRGYDTIEKAVSFIKKSQEILHDPFLLNDMDIAVDRIIKAIKGKEKITIYGDYDVDGVTSVSILYLYLEKVGAVVDYYIPCRKGEGYGVSSVAIDKICKNGTKLIITVDTGVTAGFEAEYASSLGIDMVITDHHECTDVLPKAIAVINPKRRDSTYPFQNLSGVGVAFKLLCAIENKLKSCSMIDAVRSIAYEYSDLTAIGTIADVMPVVDENRILISLGLGRAEVTDKIGLASLINNCRNGEGKASNKYKQKKKLSSGFVGFTLAPRINAAGRISSASIAVDLFLAKDENKANDYALQLCEINRERQATENKIAEEAYDLVEKHGYSEKSMIVLDNCDWHHGVVGIVASRVTDRYGVPSILISFEGNDDPNDMEAIGKGSGRSVEGMNLVNALTECEDLLEKFGGHELAAGLSIKRKYLDEFRFRMEAYANKCFAGAEPEQILDIDCELDPNDINIGFAEELCCLEPYGVSNPTPVFALRNALISDVTPVGLNRHLKLCITKDGYAFTAMLFSTTPQEFGLSVGDEVDIAFNLDVNEFNGVSSVQISIKDIRPSERNIHFELVNEQSYESAKNGESLLEPEYIIPSRDDCIKVYNFLISAARMGKETYRISRLLSDILRQDSSANINYVKLKFIIKIFRELNIINIEELDKLSFAFHIGFSKNKTNLEKSSILKKLKSMYPKK